MDEIYMNKTFDVKTMREALGEVLCKLAKEDNNIY